MDASLELAAVLVASGVTSVVCTPHLRYEEDTRSAAIEVCEETRGALARAGIPLDLHLGFEVAFGLAADLGPADLRRYTLAGTRYLLLEIPHTVWPAYAEEVIHQVRLQGMVPVLAHPERNPRLQSSPALISRLLRLGAVLQGTTSSLLGLFGSESAEFMLELIERGQLALVATDAHYQRRQTWDFGRGLERITQRAPAFPWEMAASSNPARLLADRPLEEVAAAPVARGLRRYLRGLWG